MEDKREPLSIQLRALDEQGVAVIEAPIPPIPPMPKESSRYAGSLATGEEVDRTKDLITPEAKERKSVPIVLRGVMREMRRQRKVRRAARA